MYPTCTQARVQQLLAQGARMRQVTWASKVGRRTDRFIQGTCACACAIHLRWQSTHVHVHVHVHVWSFGCAPWGPVRIVCACAVPCRCESVRWRCTCRCTWCCSARSRAGARRCRWRLPRTRGASSAERSVRRSAVGYVFRQTYTRPVGRGRRHGASRC